MISRTHLSRAVLAASVLLLAASSLHAWTSTKVPYDGNDRLTYPADAEGNRIPDFSNAGYMGGGVPLPTVPVVRTISPIAGDNTAHIQAAIDLVGTYPLQANGYRGALKLSTGNFQITGTLRLNVSGVVLAGSGDGYSAATNTIIQRTGTSQSAAIVAGGGSDDSFESEVTASRSQITTPLVQVGSRSLEVDTPSLYAVGDNIIVLHPSTQAWIDAVDKGGTPTNQWKAGDLHIRYHRYITAIEGDTITIDAPVFTNLDRALSQSYVYKYKRAGVVTNVGIQDVFVDIVTTGSTSENHCKDAIVFVQVENGWIRDSSVQHFWRAGVRFGGSATRCTAEGVRAIYPHSKNEGGRRYNFCTEGAQLILFKDCFASYARHAFVNNGTTLDSGIVFLNSTIDNPLTYAEPHRRWSTGILFDGIVTTNRTATNEVLAIYNRGSYGTGHGWAAAHSVVWRSNAAGGKILVQQPPTAQNYAIGCFGNVTGVGPFTGGAGFLEGANVAGLVPASLYEEQVAQRLPLATPAFSLGGGIHAAVQTVMITTASPGASIRYTTDGSTPSASVGTLYTGPFSINASMTLKAVSYREGWTSSAVRGETYLITSVDGVANLLPYAFNFAPGEAPRVLAPAVGVAGLPFIHLDPETSHLRIEYLRRRADSSPGIVYRAEFSSDLVNWSMPSGAVEEAADIDAVWQRVRLDDHLAPSPGSPRFGRVKVEMIGE